MPTVQERSSGQVISEYALILAVIVLTVVATLTALGLWMRDHL